MQHAGDSRQTTDEKMPPVIHIAAALAAAFATFQGDSTIPRDGDAAAVVPALGAPAPQPVTGTVQDTAGRPLSDAQVIIPALNRVTTTNEAGAFTFTGLPAGTYHIITILIGYATGHGDVTVTEAAPPPALTIVMRRASAVTQLSAVQVTATPIGTDPRDVAQATSAA